MGSQLDAQAGLVSWSAGERLELAGGSGGAPNPGAEVTFQSQPTALFISWWSGLKPNPTAPVPSAEPKAWQEGQEDWPTGDAFQKPRGPGCHHRPGQGRLARVRSETVEGRGTTQPPGHGPALSIPWLASGFFSTLVVGHL